MILSDLSVALVYGFGGFCPCMEEEVCNDQYEEWGEEWGEEYEEEYIDEMMDEETHVVVLDSIQLFVVVSDVAVNSC